MQIQLKQHEIIEAIKIYLAHKGLSLDNKQVSAEFSMTRKPSLVSAEVSITDVLIPGFSDAKEEPTKPHLATVTNLPQQEYVPEPEAAPASEDVGDVNDETETKKTASLFGP